MNKIRKLKLKKLLNTRDLGDLPSDYGVILHGKLIRSGKLYKLPPKTVNMLKEMGVTKIVDLRTQTEGQERPDTELPFAESVSIPILCTATPGIVHGKSMRKIIFNESKRLKAEFGTADNYMKAVYENMLFHEDSKTALDKALHEIINEEGCVLWHCSAGKDRAGICSMILETLLGVPEEVIVTDYTLSAKFQRKKQIWQKILLWIVPVPRRIRAMLLGMMAAKREYIQHAIQKIKEKHGDVVNYCKNELSITDGDILRLRRKCLVSI